MRRKEGKRRGPRKATARHLEKAALHYLRRFATSSANLRRVLMGKVERSARFHGTGREEGERDVGALIARFEANGLLDDKRYAENLASSLHRRGASARAISAKLAQKGVDGEIVQAALAALAQEHPEPELAAAAALVRRRRLGPYREAGRRPQMRQKDLAALARAGFAYGVALRTIDAATPQDLEAEIEGGS